MAGYTRNDVTDQIANGNTVDAIPLDGEFNAIQVAFAAVGGHRHDGSPGEGAGITVIGPTQDVVASANSLTPKTDNTVDLGSSTLEWKDLYVDGVANIDSLVADTADINGGTIDGAVIGGTIPAAITATSVTIAGDTATTNTATQTLTNKTINLANNTLVATSAQLAASVSDETGSGALVFANSPALSGFPTAPTAAADTNTTQIATTAHVFAERSNIATLANKTLTSPTINGGTISGITDLAVSDGGTGVSTITGIIKGNGISPFSAAVAGTDFLAPSAIGTTIQAYDADLNALSGLSSTGIIVRTGAGLATTRSITAGTGISISNGDGVSGNPVISVTQSGIPSGAIMPFAMSTAPSGWLKANGQAVSRTTYADLFAAIGTTYGSGDGSTTFNLPDLRAEFIRGWDDGRGVDSGRGIGTTQTDQNKAHTHTGSTSSDGAHTHTAVAFTVANPSLAGTGSSGTQVVSGNTSSAGAHTHSLTINSDGGTEARPRNVAMLYCIKV